MKHYVAIEDLKTALNKYVIGGRISHALYSFVIGIVENLPFTEEIKQ